MPARGSLRYVQGSRRQDSGIVLLLGEHMREYARCQVISCLLTDHALQSSLHEVWIPRADGSFLADAPQQLVLQGSIAGIPFVTGVSRPTTVHGELNRLLNSCSLHSGLR